MRHHHRRHPVGRREGSLPGQHPKQRAAKRIHVRAAIERKPGENLRGGVGHRRDQRDSARQLGVVEGTRDTEVAQQDALTSSLGAR